VADVKKEGRSLLEAGQGVVGCWAGCRQLRDLGKGQTTEEGQTHTHAHACTCINRNTYTHAHTHAHTHTNTPVAAAAACLAATKDSFVDSMTSDLL
jgi:ABC-type nickel/cobalt efflux system permease component RcnA